MIRVKVRFGHPTYNGSPIIIEFCGFNKSMILKYCSVTSLRYSSIRIGFVSG